MRRVILAMQMTLDGFSTGPNGEMDYLPPFNDEKSWKDLHEEMWNQLRSADTFLLGRVTYQIWEKYWPAAATSPSSTKNDIEFSKFADKTQKIVFSKTLEKAEWQNTRLVKENIAEEIARMKQQPGKNMVVAGGAGIAQTFIRLGLIDEYLVTVHPVILGIGKPLFGNLGDKIKLKLVGTKTFNTGAVELRYQPKTESGTRER
jgi:dihydrofolate reductase